MLFILLNDQNILFVLLISGDIHENVHEKVIRGIVENVLKTIDTCHLGQCFSKCFLVCSGVLEILSEGPRREDYFNNTIKMLAA